MMTDKTDLMDVLKSAAISYQYASLPADSRQDAEFVLFHERKLANSRDVLRGFGGAQLADVAFQVFDDEIGLESAGGFAAWVETL